MSAHTRIDMAAHDAGWTIEHHEFVWIYSSPEEDLAVGTQYTVTGRPRQPQVRIGGTLRPVTGPNVTAQIIAIIENTQAPTRPASTCQPASPPRPQGEHGGTAADGRPEPTLTTTPAHEGSAAAIESTERGKTL
ncbi:hypothetical protein [Mycobacteroides abscessus]|uniref:hypothetical protein n=1 Tax=Mycobacteroides abscessus TaxID=36809 RepID=UPI0009265A71|nr:hypothetical protein [Mycobacteroides abscessus]SIC19710.1 Uncharacterised protein [Mycobacteroides abscessus subsp. abscessus]